MVIPPTGGGDDKVVHAGGGDLSIPPPEHGCKIYYNQDHYGPVPGGRGKPGQNGVEAAVAAGVPGLGRDVGGGMSNTTINGRK